MTDQHARPLCITACIAALIASAATTGVTAAANEPELASVQITARRVREPVAEVSQAVTIVDASTIRARTPQVIAEALRGAPGAYFQQTAPGQGMAIVRGLKGSEVLHLVDGIRLNNAFFRTSPSQYVALVDPLAAARIELVRGPAATSYGSDAMGGVIHVLTREERFDAPEWRARGQAMATYASGDAARQVRLVGAAGRRDLSLALGASHFEYGARDVAGLGQSASGAGVVSLRDRVAPTGYDARAYDAKLLWQPTDGHEWMLSWQSYAFPSLPRYNEVVPGFGTAAAGLPDAAISIYDNSRRFAHIRYRGRTDFAAARRVEFHAARQRVLDDRFDRSLDLTTDSLERNRSTLDGLTLQAETDIGARWSLTYGTDFYRDGIDSSRVEVRAGVSTRNGANVAVKSRFPDGARTDQFGVYALAGWRASQVISIDFSARFDRIDTQLPIADRLAGGAFTDDSLTGGIGLLWRLTPTWNFAANTRRGLRAPNINDLAQIGRRSNNRIVIANPGLGSESVWSVDAGVRGASNGWRFDLTAFHSEYQDRIALIDTGVVYTAGQNGCDRAAGCLEAQNRNISRANYSGVEAGAAWERAPWSLSGALNYTYGEQRANGLTTPANRVPPVNATVAAAWQANERWTVEARAWLAGRQNRLDPADLRDNRINPSGTPGYSSFDLMTTWRPTEALDVRLTGKNLTDRAFREHGSGINAVGRSLSISLDYRFGAR